MRLVHWESLLPDSSRELVTVRRRRHRADTLISHPDLALRDVDLVHARDGGALGDVWREQPQRLRFARGVNRPPDRVPARTARRERGAVTEWTRVSFEGGKDDPALARLMAML